MIGQESRNSGRGPELAGEDWFRQGLSLVEAQDYGQAVEAFTKALKTEPKFTEAYLNRGVAWVLIGKPDRAIDDFTRALEIDPSYVDAYIFRGINWYKKGDCEQAVADYTSAVEIDPNCANFSVPLPVIMETYTSERA